MSDLEKCRAIADSFIDATARMKPETAHKVRQAHEIADAALQHMRERAVTYEQPEGERSAEKIAIAFNAITGKDLTESEVFLILQILKDVRQWAKQEYHQDSAEDCIGYSALKAEALEREGN